MYCVVQEAQHLLPSKLLIVGACSSSDHRAASLLRTERDEEGSHFVAISAFRCIERMVITLYGIDRSLSPRRIIACACCVSAKLFRCVQPVSKQNPFIHRARLQTCQALVMEFSLFPISLHVRGPLDCQPNLCDRPPPPWWATTGA